ICVFILFYFILKLSKLCAVLSRWNCISHPVFGISGINCELLPCEDVNPCDNGAECVEEADPVLFPLGFRCRCHQGFTGPRCEINIDECSSNPCLHGFCYDGKYCSYISALNSQTQNVSLQSDYTSLRFHFLCKCFLCVSKIGNCISSPCVFPASAVDGFYCLCNPGYAGIRCEQDINDCVSNMCENNSTCVDLHLSYDCLCLPGWEGEFCQWETDECSSNPCKNNATCTDLLNAYRCMCPRGWTGLDCGEDVKECSSSPCLNGAHCVESDIPGEFSCTCPPFFTGPLCEQAYDPCDLRHNSCLHNSTCRAKSDGTAHCVCPPGFSGQRCEEDINECASNPCQNRGSCVDLQDKYACICAEGFTGKNCEIDQNVCLQTSLNFSLCFNGGTCVDGPGANFTCSCLPGFVDFCEVEMNECCSEPCFHGAICQDLINGYQCHCRPGEAFMYKESGLPRICFILYVLLICKHCLQSKQFSGRPLVSSMNETDITCVHSTK
uniref:EGF-like domain-containing protein n=1 Tax=Sinocyclocheilus rhinocerous TaxID=307959 RepID=A0A673I8G4_9TELE